MSNLVVHFEIHASEPEQLVEFYSRLLGWRFARFGEMPYWVIDTGDGAITMGSPGRGINGGLTQRQGPAPERGSAVNGATVVIGVGEDVDALYRLGLELGASEALPLSDLPGVGRLGYLADPDGNVFGLIAPTEPDQTSSPE